MNDQVKIDINVPDSYGHNKDSSISYELNRDGHALYSHDDSNNSFVYQREEIIKEIPDSTNKVRKKVIRGVLK